MQTLKKLRNYEFLLIAFATTIYVIRRLFYEANNFDWMVETVELNKVPARIIWKSLEGYDHIASNNFPTIVAVSLFLVAWYIFHYMTFPRIKERVFDSTTFTYLILVLIICVSGVQIYEYLKLYIRFKYDESGGVLGLKVYSEYRKLTVFTNTVAVVMILFVYEAFAQFYYYIQTKLSKEKEQNYQYLAYTLNVILAALILLFGLFGSVSQDSFWYGSVRELLIFGVGGATIYFTQKRFYLNVFPYISTLPSKEFSKGITNFFIINLLGAFTTTIIATIPFFNFIQITVGTTTVFLVYTFSSIFIAIIRRVFTQEKTQLQTQIVSKSAELSSLRSQINPHFLFNALNTLYSVSLKEKAEKTSDGIQKLGDMMRFMLNENHQDRISLSKEIEYLHNYIAIQRMRIDESQNIEIKINIQDNEQAIFIAPMLLNPFIENAFKHGISFRSPSWIYITLTHDAQKLYFKVHNSLHPKQEIDLEEENNGTECRPIGLENVRKRLELIYPNRYTLDIQASDNDYFVSLVLGIY